MKFVAVIPHDLERKLYGHLFQGELEQGGFLFSRIVNGEDEVRLEAVSAYLVPPDGWEVQAENYLELKDMERSKIMKIARDGGYALIDCHSHPASDGNVWFSSSDRSGITDFAAYVRWKLDGKPYIATVWGESSVDAVAWSGDFIMPMPVSEVQIVGESPRVLVPEGTWYRRTKFDWQGRNRWKSIGTLARSLPSGKRGKGR